MTDIVTRPDPTASPTNAPRRRSRRRRRDRGAALVEFAMAFPILVLLMMGVIDFGVNYGNKVQSTHAAREGARAGSVGRVGTDADCDIYGTTVSIEVTRLVCLTKARTHMDDRNVRVRIAYMDGSGRYTNDFSDATRLANKYSIMVCVASRAYSLSGMLTPIFDGKFHHARAVIKTGTTPWATDVPGVGTVYSYVPQFAETPMTGDSWSWCTSDDPTQDVTI